MTIEQYTADYEREVALFNRRLREAGVEFQFPENATPAWLPRLNNRHIYQEYFVATEDGRVVYGGYILKHQNFLLGEEIAPIGDYQLPLSEGIISEQYKLIGLQLLYHALNRQPMLYALGMGGIGRPLPLFLKRMKWDLCEIPFYFRILKPFRFLRNIRTLR
ncbi:MAG: hypothetical protein KAU36_07390, partial [candidate division Zixibacteria bacterium]|nr:hypothetical protein [candidate division Zixibacteria bacterium]